MSYDDRIRIFRNDLGPETQEKAFTLLLHVDLILSSHHLNKYKLCGEKKELMLSYRYDMNRMVCCHNLLYVGNVDPNKENYIVVGSVARL